MAQLLTRRNCVVGILATLLGGCVYERDHGPPPHAPAHGYRRKHRDNVVLVYDAGIGVYVVSGRPGYYYDGTYFYRPQGDVWLVSVSVDGPWQSAGHDHVPPGLRRKNRDGDHPGKGKGRS